MLWFWYLFLTVFAVIRFFYRVVQLSSKAVRYHVMRARISRYFKKDSNMRHVEHYAKNCSIGDWFVLYQMSRNMNRRFFAEFITVLSHRVNPCPGVKIHSPGGNSEADEADCAPFANENGEFARCESGISLHSKIVDMLYDEDYVGGGGDDGGKEKKEKDDDKKDKEEEKKKDDSKGRKDQTKRFRGEESKWQNKV